MSAIDPLLATRNISRTLRCLLALFGCVGGLLLPCGTSGTRSTPCPCSADDARFPPRFHPSCKGMGDPFHEITGLAVDYLNNHIDPPHAFSIQSGSLYSYEEAQFHVYGLTQYPLYYQVTEMFLPCPTGKSTGVVQVKQGPGSRSVAGRVKVVNVDGNLIVTYRPNRKSNVHRTAILTFTYDAGYKSPLTTQFSLDIFPSS